MKTVFLLAMAIFVLNSCNQTKTPKAIVSDYLSAIDNFDFDKAKTLLVPNAENTAALNGIQNYAAGLSEDAKKEQLEMAKKRVYYIIEKEVQENKALIIATVNEGSFTSVVTFELTKENGKWLIEKFKADVG